MAELSLDRHAIRRGVLSAIHKRVLANFIYRNDRQESWLMPPPDYDGSQKITDDCDGFCLAVRTLLRKQNIASRLVYCELKGRGHLVVEVQGWVFCNLQDDIRSNSLLISKGYRFKRISGFEPGEPWRVVI
jgi:hypothetical protein